MADPTVSAIGEVIALGVGVALSPLAVVSAVALLAADDGVRIAGAFVLVWAAALAGGAVLVVLFADGLDPRSGDGPATWVSVAKLAVAALLVAVAVQQWRGRGREDDPAWARKLDGATPVSAARLAFVLALVKPKNLLLTVAAGLVVAQSGASANGQALALAVYVAIAAAPVAIPLGLRLVSGERGAARARDVRDWVVRESPVVIAVVALLFAAQLGGDALTALAG